MTRPSEATYCQRCVYPQLAVNLLVDDDGVCSACLSHAEFEDLTPAFWADREARFAEFASDAKARRRTYDCIIPVSGGKDSYFQVHTALRHGLKPLLVTYHGNNYLPEGQRNLDRMRSVFDVDHLVVKPSEKTLVALNRLGFFLMGDMNWHSHAGIKIVPMQVAVRYEVPLVIWGETTWTISGMFSPDDYVQYNKRTVLEHDCRGFTWEDMVDDSEGLTPRDLELWKFPSDDDIARVGVRGIYVGNFFPWKPNDHTQLVIDEYGFEVAAEPFQRTFRRMSNLDDMHENGAHDYLKFVKFGYGRASDHASKDIRDGLMTREEGVNAVRTYDHVRPTTDLARWFDYTGVSEEAFDRHCDTLRDPRVWWRQDGAWAKHTLWNTVDTYERHRAD